MKINIILPFKRMSGGIRVIYIYANYLVQEGHDVCCYLPAVSYRGKGQSSFFRLRASISNTFKRESWYETHFPVRVVPQINNLFVRNADVVIATAWQTAYDVIKLDKSKGKKFYFVQGLETYNGDKEIIDQSFMLDMHIITITNGLKKYLLQYNNRIDVVYNGLYDNEFIKGEKEKKSNFSVMVLYHEEPTKGTEDGIKVIKQLREEGNNVEGILFGRKVTGEFPDYFHIYQNPPRNKLMELYAHADVYLFTSHHDAWGLTVAEAMAQKCAVIGREIGIIEELNNGRNFVIVNNDQEMLKKTRLLYENRQLLRELQNEGHKTALNLRWDTSAKEFTTIITHE